MGRDLRITVPGSVYHLTSRGNNNETIFIARRDYQKFLSKLKEYKKELDFKLYVYCLMKNHFHLLVEEGRKTNISRLMQKLNTAYSMYFNKKYARRGHLFENRFFSSQVDRDEYLLEVSRYIHLNPVRAELLGKPEEYSWSSCWAYLNLEEDELIDKEEVLGLFGGTPERQVKNYKDFLYGQLEAEKRAEELAVLKLVPDLD
jgi:REP element-mobilizing transposase RayT